MTWEELEQKHSKQWSDYNAGRDKDYAEMRQKHDELRHAFRDLKVDVPSVIKERMNKEYEGWCSKWEHNGQTMNDLRQKQVKEIRDKAKIEKLKDQLQEKKSRESHRGRDNDR